MPQYLKNVRLWSGAYDLSGDTNQLSVNYEFPEVEIPTFGDGVRHSLPGIPKIGMDFSGLAYSNATVNGPDDVINANLGTANVVTTFAPNTGAIGSATATGGVCYFTKSLTLGYTPGGAVGEAYAFTARGVSQGEKLIRGTVLEQSAKTTTATGTPLQIGAVSASQYLYAAMHVIAVSGTDPTLDLILQSDDAESFLSGTARITFAQKVAVGSQYATAVAGPITDTWWRTSYTITGTNSPSFTVVVVVGIL